MRSKRKTTLPVPQAQAEPVNSAYFAELKEELTSSLQQATSNLSMSNVSTQIPEIIVGHQKQIMEDLAVLKRQLHTPDRRGKQSIQWLMDCLGFLYPSLADVDVWSLTSNKGGGLFHRTPGIEVENEARGRLCENFDLTESDPILLRLYYCVWAVVDATKPGLNLENTRDQEKFRKAIEVP